MNYAVLLSGGTGKRIESEVPKQYIKCAGHMMVTYALEPLLKCIHIDRVCIVAEHEWRKSIIGDAKLAGLDTEKFFGFAIPGTNRQTSILNAMQEILKGIGTNEAVKLEKASDEDTVIFHDAARPFLTVEMLDKCYEELFGHDGVMPVLPMKDTVYRSTNGCGVSELLDRNEIFAGQAPELFRLKFYYQANIKLMPDKIYKINGASEPAIMDGMDIVMIPGDENNFKVTTQMDLERFRQLTSDR